MLKLPMLLGTTVVVALLLVSGSTHVHASMCRQSGYFALVDNTAEFYACRASPGGGFSLQFMRCSAGSVFSSKAGHCTEVVDLSLMAREDGNIENPTIPPSNDDDSSSAKPAEGTTPTPIPTAAPFSDNTEDTTGDAPSSSAEPSAGTTEKPEEGSSVRTDEPSTNEPSTGEPSTGEPSTGAPSTGEPSTDEPSTDDSTTDEPSTDDSTTDEPSTDDSTTDEPSTDDSTTDEPSSDTTDSDTTDDGSATAATPVLDCPSSGFFPMSDKCDQFILCAVIGSELKSEVYRCPEGMQFNPYDSFCSADYDCTTRD